MMPDMQQYINFESGKYGYIGDEQSYYFSLVSDFNQSWAQELGRFYQDGTPPGRILFPAKIPFGGWILWACQIISSAIVSNCARSLTPLTSVSMDYRLEK